MIFRVKNKKIKVFELIKRYELEPIETEGDGNPFVFTIDVIREVGKRIFHCKVFRKEFFRLAPSFQKEKRNDELIEECDEEILVEDLSECWSNISENSAEKALKKALENIKQIFGG